MFRQYFFAGSALLGDTPRQLVPIKEDWLEPASRVWVCQICGEVYQRAPCIRESTGIVSIWCPVRGVCPTCGPKARSLHDWPGTFYLPADFDFNAALPQSVLLHDFHAHYLHHKRFLP